MAIIRYIWDGRQKVKSPIVWDFPDIRKPGLKSKPPPLRINILFSPRTLGGLVNFAEQLACVTCVALGATYTSSCAGCREGFRVLGWYRSFVKLAVNYCFWVIQHSENVLWTAISGRDPFKFPEISVQNSMDRFGPTGKVSKKEVHLLRWSSFPGRTSLNFGWMDRAQCFLLESRAHRDTQGSQSLGPRLGHDKSSWLGGLGKDGGR